MIDHTEALSRRGFVGAAAALIAAGSVPARAADKTVRIGYQKYGNLLLLKVSGLLEAKLAPLGWRVEWKQFLSGPPLMEALSAGAIDFGSAGETPPIFAQAAGAPLVYYGAEPPAPHGEAILVLNDSPLKTLADLKGKRVCFTKGANVHYLFVKAIAKAGLTLHDVKPVYLSPPDGRAAFESGNVDAWVIWDPFFAAAQSTGRARVLADGEGLASNNQFYFGSRRFNDGPVLAIIRDAIAQTDRQAAQDLAAAAKTLSPSIGLPEDVILIALKRQTFAIQPFGPQLVAAQQAIADTFSGLALIPKAIDIRDALPVDASGAP